MKKLYPLISLIVLQSYCLPLKSQDLQFYREDIVFQVFEDVAVIDARYYFCNLGEEDINKVIFYPFPENTIELIDSLVIIDLKTNRAISFRKSKSGVFFGISVSGYGQAQYRVYFRQWLSGKKFKYILTSTESWGRPLEFANFELQAPAYLTINSLSYPADSSFIQNNVQYLFWKKKDFMPDKDFEVFFDTKR